MRRSVGTGEADERECVVYFTTIKNKLDEGKDSSSVMQPFLALLMLLCYLHAVLLSDAFSSGHLLCLALLSDAFNLAAFSLSGCFSNSFRWVPTIPV